MSCGVRSEFAGEFAVGIGQGFRQDFGVGQHRHEISVALPAGDDMRVEMVLDAGPGHPSQVYPNVESR